MGYPMCNLPYGYARHIVHNYKTLPWFPGSQIRKALEILGELGCQKAKKQRLSLGLCPYSKVAKGSVPMLPRNNLDAK